MALDPQHDSALVVIGGLVADVDPVNLPPGAAPICSDMDFTVGSVFSRDGIANVYTYDGSDQENNAGLGTDIPVAGAQPWSNPDNISFNSPGTYASVQLGSKSVGPFLAYTLGFNSPGSGASNYTINFGTNPTLGTWISGTLFTLGTRIADSNGNLQTVVVPGTSGLSAPTWKTSPGQLTIDNGVTWEEGGAANIFALGDTLLIAIQTISPTSGIQVSTFTDSIGNVFGRVTEAPTYTVGGEPVRLELWSAVVTVPLPSGNPYSISLTTTAICTLRMVYFADLASLGAVLGVTSATGTGIAPQPGALTTPNALLVAWASGNELQTATTPVGFTQFPSASADGYLQLYCYQIVGPGTYNPSFTQTSTDNWSSLMVAFALPTATLPGSSDVLQANTYALAVPSTSGVLGLELQVSGHQTATTTVLTVTPSAGGTPTTFSLPSIDGMVTLGGAGEFFGLTGLIPAQVNDPGFSFNITAADASGNESRVDIYAVELKVWYTPPGVKNFNFIDSFEMQNGSIFTIALDDTGVLWQEDVLNNPDVLTPFYTEVEPNTYAQAITYDDRQFMAFSNRSEATDIPRQYNGQWVDRVSQVGPGAPPSFSATSQTYDVVSITQPAAQGVFALLWSTGPGNDSIAGNVITIYYGSPGATAPATPPDPNIILGDAVYLHGFANLASGASPNGTFIISGVGTTLATGSPGHGVYNTFTVQGPSTQLVDRFPNPAGTYNATIATLTTATPIPNVQVGSQISLSGVSPSSWNATWTVLFTPNASQLNITSTSLSGNVATYDFTLITGTAPVVNQQVTVVGTDNGDGIFNVVNATITAVSPSSFSISLPGPNISPAAEADAQAIVNGTIFQFDPGLNFVGTNTDPIFGNGTGGTVTQPGNLGAGVRQGVVFFKTRNAALTPCSAPLTFTLTEGANSIVATNIPLGPPNVVARICSFTGAGGAFFYWIPQPVTITSNGQKITYTSTVVNDNISTQATFTFTDAVLLESLEIDIQGNNLFEQIELGSCLGFVAYATRLFAIGEQNKIQNLVNMSFDGGYLPNPLGSLQPLGWTVDLVSGGNGSLSVSPIFGNSYYILNATGSTIAGATGMIEQTAFQDYLQTPIIDINTQYGVRVTASCPGGISGGGAALVVDLFSPTFNRVYGSFSIPLASMTPEMAIFTGDLLTAEFFSAVPSDLLLRIYATGLLNGGDVMLDRVEPFDLSQPVLTTQLRGSYFDNFEAFDDVTGNLGFAVENQQEIRSAFELFDNLYVVRTRSMASTTDNGITEPDGWTVREVSNKVGTPSVHGVDVGEGWAVIAGLAGVYVFDGGQPTKFSPEIDPLWNTINWTFGYTVWVKNDTNNRMLSIGVPLPTPNQWMPKFPANPNPTQPNVILICQYKELMSSSALAGEGPVRQSYTGTLKSYQLGRKWSAWSIEAAYGDFITRDDTTQPLFYCGDTDTAKIYQQIEGLHTDDGAGIFDQYITYPFIKSDEAQQLQTGLHNLMAEFCTALVIGGGNLNVTIYPNTLDSPYATRLDPPFGLLDPPPYGDTEMPANVPGNRFFVGFETDAAGDWFELSRVVLQVIMDPWSPLRGSNGGND